MSDCVNNFWNEIALMQMASGKAPSVITEDMKKVMAGDKDAAVKMEQEIDVKGAINKGINYKISELKNGI